jgi:hypothetical protein
MILRHGLLKINRQFAHCSAYKKKCCFVFTDATRKSICYMLHYSLHVLVDAPNTVKLKNIA